MWNQWMPGLRMTALLTVLTGLIYPGIVTGLCQAIFSDQANGSLIVRNGRAVGSSLIGQNFADAKYFHPRPSAAGANGYDATASGGSNLGPVSKKLVDRVKASVAEAKVAGPVPADMVTTSASGLDPHISPETAQLQVARVAAARGVPPAQIEALVSRYTESRDLGMLGEARVNVLLLNLALDEK